MKNVLYSVCLLLVMIAISASPISAPWAFAEENVEALNINLNFLQDFLRIRAFDASVDLKTWEDSMHIKAAEVDLIRITSDAMEGYSDFLVPVDDQNNILAMSYYASSSKERKDFPLSQLPHGIVLYASSGFNILTIKSDKFNPTTGGPLDLIYLYNAFTRKYGTFHTELVKVDNKWTMQIQTRNGPLRFTTMFLKKREFLGKVIGIERIQVP